MTKLLKSTIRKLSELSLELFRNREADLSLEVHKMSARLYEIQEQLSKETQEKP